MQWLTCWCVGPMILILCFLFVAQWLLCGIHDPEIVPSISESGSGLVVCVLDSRS